MSLSRYTSPAIAKELRELGPLWLITLAGMVIGAVTLPYRGVFPIGASLYAVCAVALGAMSVGHEYRHRTLAVLLAQPTGRARMLVVKGGVLVVLLGVLGAAAWFAWAELLPTARPRDLEATLPKVWLLLPIACGLFLAPLLTMLCRSEMAGTVFAVALPAIIFIGAEIVTLLHYGLTPTETQEAGALRRQIFETGVIGTCAVGAIGTVWSFLHLQAIDGPAAPVRLPNWLRADHTTGDRAPGLRRRSPYLVLAQKELRLQVLPFSIAGLYAASWVAVWFSRGAVDPRIDLDALIGGFSGFYIGAVSVLVGAIASAEERQLRTLGSQLLVPIAFWKQWSVKVTVVAGLAVTLAIGLPLLLQWVMPVSFDLLANLLDPEPLAVILGLVVVSLYVSSFNTGGLRAFLMTIGLGIVAAGLVTLVLGVMRYVPARQFTDIVAQRTLAIEV